MEEAYLQVVGWAGHHLVALEAYPGVASVARGGDGRRGGGADITNYYDVKARARDKLKVLINSYFSPLEHTWWCSDGVQSSSLAVACTPLSSADKLFS